MRVIELLTGFLATFQKRREMYGTSEWHERGIVVVCEAFIRTRELTRPT